MNEANGAHDEAARPSEGANGSAHGSPPDFERRVIEILAEQSGTDPAQIVRATNLIELGDSLDRMEAVMKLEEEFELSIPDPDIEALRTVGQLTDYLRPRCDGRSRAGSA